MCYAICFIGIVFVHQHYWEAVRQYEDMHMLILCSKTHFYFAAVQIIYNKETGQSRGFGFITMSTVEQAEKAVEIFHGSVNIFDIHE